MKAVNGDPARPAMVRIVMPPRDRLYQGMAPNTLLGPALTDDFGGLVSQTTAFARLILEGMKPLWSLRTLRGLPITGLA